MTFFETKHCTSHRHCGKCRAKVGGLKWRMSIAESFEGIMKDNFKCPEGRKWTKEVPASERKPVNSRQVKTRERMDKLPDTKDANWCRKMVAQCLALFERPPRCITCRDKRAFRDRCMEKVDYYFGVYETL